MTDLVYNPSENEIILERLKFFDELVIQSKKELDSTLNDWQERLVTDDKQWDFINTMNNDSESNAFQFVFSNMAISALQGKSYEDTMKSINEELAYEHLENTFNELFPSEYDENQYTALYHMVREDLEYLADDPDYYENIEHLEYMHEFISEDIQTDYFVLPKLHNFITEHKDEIIADLKSHITIDGNTPPYYFVAPHGTIDGPQASIEKQDGITQTVYPDKSLDNHHIRHAAYQTLQEYNLDNKLTNIFKDLANEIGYEFDYNPQRTIIQPQPSPII